MIWTALAWAAVITGPPLGVALIVIFRPWELIPRRRAPRYAPRHATREMTPAEVEEWLAEVTEADRPVPYWPAYLPAPAPRGAVRAGQDRDPAAGPPWQPAAVVTSPGDGGPLPRPEAAPPVAAGDYPGPGQPFAPEVVQYPDGNYAIRDERGHWHIKPLAWDGRSPRETGGQPALVRPGWRAYDAWRDAAVNVP